MEQIAIEVADIVETHAEETVQALTLTELALVGGGSVIMCMD